MTTTYVDQAVTTHKSVPVVTCDKCGVVAQPTPELPKSFDARWYTLKNGSGFNDVDLCPPCGLHVVTLILTKVVIIRDPA